MVNKCAFWALLINCTVSLATELSIIVTVYNKEHQIEKVIRGIVENSTSPFELVMVYDGCVDRSEEIVNETLWHNPGLMDKLTVVYTPDVNETKANNAGMKAASGTYFILVQDDMCITEEGWEKRLLKPLKTFRDVFAVSALWAADYLPFTNDVQQQKYHNPCRGYDRTKFVVRDVICRGPLALDATVVRQLNYLDEAYAPLFLDDHDLCLRAYQRLKKVCGVYQISWTPLKKTAEGHVKMSNGQYFIDAIKTNRKLFWKRYKGYFARQKKHSGSRVLV